MKETTEQERRELLKASLVKVKELKAQLAAIEEAQREPIAIVGAGCRFPGGAESPAGFWDLLDEGRDAIQPLVRRWAQVGARASEDAPRWGGLLAGAVDGFDAAFFGVSPREARSLDPQHRLLLEVAWEALEDAGVPPQSLHGSRTGVFLGASTTDYDDIVKQQPRDQRDAYAITGTLLSVAAGRLSYTLGLQGPCLTVDTACSSSLVAVHLACRSLRAGESDLALAGGVNLLLSAELVELMSRTQALSPDGRCKTFDALANGMVRGEGCGLVVLKRLADARRDGDPIWALIRGSAVNQDGRSTGLTAPNVLAQEALLRRALRESRVEPGDIGFVETHGTGTSLGDPIEVEALRAVLGAPRPDAGRCVLGAVKTNIGHLEAAAGIAGLLKAVLALRHERIPRNLNFRALNPHLRLEGTALALAVEPVPWPRSARPRLAGVSSFGISGTNAHVVLEEAPAAEPMPAAPQRSAELLVLSARSAAALDAAAARLRDHLEAHPELGVGDVAFSLATTRSHLEHRLAVAATSREALREALSAAAEGKTPPGAVRGCLESGGTPKVVFVFPGQGSQWRGVGQKLLAEEPVFRAAMEACDRAIQAEAGWSLLDELTAEAGASRLGRVDVNQPTLFAIEVALAALWRSWGVKPDAVVGHSMGEVAAAHVAGALSLEEAVAIVCHRSRLLRRISGQGAMAMIELSPAETEAALQGYEDRLSVAASNGPRMTVVSGEPSALAEVLSALEAREVFCQRLKVEVASHSPQVDPLREELLSALANLQPRPTTVPMRSTVTGATVAGPELLASYWADNLRRPVRFADAVQALLDDGCGLFVELSPQPTLVPAVAELQHAASADGAVVGSLRWGRDERATLLESLGALWVGGHAVAWGALFPEGGRRVPLPTYPWQRQRYWIEAPAGDAQGPRGRAHAEGHPLLGEADTLSTQAGGRLWQTTLDLQRLPQALASGAQQREQDSWFLELAWEPAAAPAATIEASRFLLLGDGGGLGAELRTALEALGHTVAHAVAGAPGEAPGGRWPCDDTSAAGVRALLGDAFGGQAPTAVVHLRSLEGGGALDAAAIEAALARGCDSALCTVQALAEMGYRDAPRLWLVTRGAQAAGDGDISLAQAPLLGLGRVIALEHPELRCARLDLDPARPEREIPAIVAELLGDDAEQEIALRGGERRVARLLRRPPEGERRERVEPAGGRAFRLEIEEPGALDALALRAVERRAPGPGEVEIAVEAAGLAIHDVKKATRIDPAPGDGPVALGADCAGRIVAVGEGVEDLSVGQEVLTVAASSVGTHVTVDARKVVHRPAALTAAQAAAIPGVLAVDLAGLAERRPERFAALLHEVVDLFDQGALDPLPVETFPISRAADALRRMAQAQHTEKVVLTLDDPEARILVRAEPGRTVRRDGSYLVTGGLGGLGLSVAGWLAREGAGHLVLMGRSGAASPEQQAAVAALEAQGTRVTVAKADVAERAQVEQALREVTASGMPLRGVIHAAGLLDDGLLLHQTPARFREVMAPKVQGSLHLHALTRAAPLDFFVLYASGAGLLGSPGQGNYAAANTFLDALAHQRRREGLPALSIDWGAFSEVGLAAAQDNRGARLASRGARSLTPEDGLSALARLLEGDRAQVGVVPLDVRQWAEFYPAAASFRMLSRLTAEEPSAAGRAASEQGLAERLAHAAPEERAALLLDFVRAQVSRVLRIPESELDTRASLIRLGLDSLMGLELRNQLKRGTAVDIPLSRLLSEMTIVKLAELLRDEDPKLAGAPTESQKSATWVDTEL